MKKGNLDAGRLTLKRMIIAGLNATEQSRIRGGSAMQQSNNTMQASEANCVTMSDDCPGPQQQVVQPNIIAAINLDSGI